MRSLLSRFPLAFFAVMAVLLSACPSLVLAGGGPENVLVVVNDDSDSSKLIANHYISLRSIPDRNVVYLKGIPFKEAIGYEDFEAKILRPVLAAIEDRGLRGSIDYIVYSADFPTTIRIGDILKQFLEKAELQKAKVDRRIFKPAASISSMTYLAGHALHVPWLTMDLRVNRYFRIPKAQMLRRPFLGAMQREFERSIAAFSKKPDDPLFESAIDSLQEMANQNPGQTAVLYWLVKFNAKRGDESAATKWMKRAIGMGLADKTGTMVDEDFSQIKDTVFEGLVSRMTNDGRTEIATRGFRQLYQWAPNGMLNKTAGQGERYFLSTVLAVTRNDGNTEAEAVRQLTRSVRADFTRPSGTFYFTSTANIRTKTRKPKFQQAVNALIDLGYRAEIVKTAMPMNKRDILGLTSGIREV